MGRNFSDWVVASSEATTESKIPLIYRRWAAISAVAGAMGRKCWYDQGEYKIRPNLYVVLIGPPGSGKTLSLQLPYNEVFSALTEPFEPTEYERAEARLLWQRYVPLTAPLYLLSDKATDVKIGHCMSLVSHDTSMLSVKHQDQMDDSSITVMTEEFGTLMSRAHDDLHILLTRMWDAGRPYDHQTRHSKSHRVKGPCLNWIACATPQQFIDRMPEDAGEQGLLTRIIPVVYDGPDIGITAKNKRSYDHHYVEALRYDLGQIATIGGEFDWEDRTLLAKVQAWLDAGQPPAPTEPCMGPWRQRRHAQVIKVAMVLSAARNHGRIITNADWEDALHLIVEVEKSMPSVLARFGRTEVGRITDLLLQYVEKKGGKIRTAELKREAARMVRNPGDVHTTIELMKESGMIEPIGETFVRAMKPRGETPSATIPIVPKQAAV